MNLKNFREDEDRGIPLGKTTMLVFIEYISRVWTSGEL